MHSAVSPPYNVAEYPSSPHSTGSELQNVVAYACTVLDQVTASCGVAFSSQLMSSFTYRHLPLAYAKYLGHTNREAMVTATCY